ncbi:MAG: tetratricopeptide repeat protein [bacterium]|nr:tetratricopeptide repeat protein [bacterium]
MRRFFSLIAVALLCASVASAATIGKDRLRLARSHTAKGDKLVKQTEYAGAEKKFRSAIAVEPLLPTAYLGLAKALIGQQRYDEALPVLEQAEKRFVEWEQTIQIAEMKKQQLTERQLQSIRDVEAAVSDKSGRLAGGAPTPGQAAPGQLTQAKIESEQFLFRENRKMEAFQAIPSQVFYLEGISYLRTNRRALGIEALEVCLTINHRHELAHYNLAVALFTRGELEEAKTHLEAAVDFGVEPHASFVADLDRALGLQRVARDSKPPS